MSSFEIPAYDLSRLSVLVVEQNFHMRTILRHALRGLGITTVREASDGAEALKLMRTFHPDIVTTAYHMQPLNGVEFVHMVRTAKDSPNPMVPIIMITAYTEEHRIKESRDAGITEFLAKPISVKGLYLRIIEVIERPRAFVKSAEYVGPDRHRKFLPQYHGPLRRSADKDIAVDLSGQEPNFDIDVENMAIRTLGVAPVAAE